MRSVVTLLIRKYPVAVSADEHFIVVMLSASDVVPFKCRRVRLSANPADRFICTEPSKLLLPAILGIKLLSHKQSSSCV
jgi:hypothetical protein